MQAKRPQRLFWEVFLIEDHKDVGAGDDGGGHHMRVFMTWQLASLDQRLEVDDEAIRHGGVHRLARPRQLFSSQIRTIREQVLDPFVVNPVAPAGAEDLRLGGVEHEESQPCAIEDVCVEEGCDRIYGFTA